jgi:hypothetical protein
MASDLTRELHELQCLVIEHQTEFSEDGG